MKYYFLSLKNFKNFERTEEKDNAVIEEIEYLRDYYQREIRTFDYERNPLIVLSNYKRAYEKYNKILNHYTNSIFNNMNTRQKHLYEAIAYYSKEYYEDNLNGCEKIIDWENATRDFVSEFLKEEEKRLREYQKKLALERIAQEQSQEQTIQEDKQEVTIEVKTPNKNYTQEDVVIEESIQAQVENKQEETTQENLAHEEVAQEEDITILSDEKAIATNTIAQTQTTKEEEKQEDIIQEVAQSEQPIQEVIAQSEIEESIQEDSIQGDSIEYSFKQYIESIIPMHNITTQEQNDTISFNFTIKKSDLMAFKAPKVYSSYAHSLKIKQGQEIARQKGIKIGLKKGSKRQRKDKQFIIDQIKKLSISFNGDKNNHELSKILHCSLNRICSYKKKIKESLESSQLNLFTE